jgi:hypothetical protein
MFDVMNGCPWINTLREPRQHNTPASHPHVWQTISPTGLTMVRSTSSSGIQMYISCLNFTSNVCLWKTILKHVLLATLQHSITMQLLIKAIVIKINLNSPEKQQV